MEARGTHRGVEVSSSAPDALALVLLAAHLLIALALRTVAWPEVTAPGHLWSRGWLMYRDIRFQHTPGTMGTLALGFAAFGPQAWFLRFYAIVWPLLAHFSLLRETRHARPIVRVLASAFFVTLLFGFEGNAVWPTVVMTALAIPIAAELSRGRVVRAGLLIGIAILFKQTAAFVLLAAMLTCAVRGRLRDAARMFLAASAPYALTLGVFFAFGAGVDMLRWTILVPLTVKPAGVDLFRPSAFQVFTLLSAFLPLLVETALERPGERERPYARWLLVVAVGFTAIVYPDFTMLNAVAGVPCLALGAAKLMERRRFLVSVPAAAYAAVFVAARGAGIAAGSELDGKVLFWNDDPAFNRVVDRLRETPPETRVYSELWGNLNARADRLPPGRIYVHPWFDWFFSVDHTGERVAKAVQTPGTVIVGYRRGPRASGVGPYALTAR
ncbi:MAG TPA: hypothetical protein VGK26_09850 [Thermoanaerobaculia bacterium]|jgi:hypothetical protein